MVRYITFLFIIFALPLFSQKHDKIYKLKVYTKDGGMTKGYLQRFSDSTIIISPRAIPNGDSRIVAFSNIKSIKARNNKSMWLGPVIGAAAGAVIGGIVGFASYEPGSCHGFFIFCVDYGPEYEIIKGAVIGVVSGGLIGLAVGSISKEIVLNGNKTADEQVMAELGKFVVPQPK